MEHCAMYFVIILLLVITIACSCGGGVRYRENFLDEVIGYSTAADDVDYTNTINTSLKEMIKVEDETVNESDSDIINHVAEEATPINRVIELPVVKPNNTPPTVVQRTVTGYSGCDYATF
jgi:hypothetical protein